MPGIASLEVGKLTVEKAAGDAPGRRGVNGALKHAGKDGGKTKDGGQINPGAPDPNFLKAGPEYKNDVLEKIIDDLNKKLNVAGRELRHSVHKKTGQVMVKVVDTDSGKTIREIPPEKSLDILAKILEQSGLLVDEKT